MFYDICVTLLQDILTFCRKHGKPYYDQEFEPVKFSLLGGDCKFPGRVFDVDTIIWKRPTVIPWPAFSPV